MANITRPQVFQAADAISKAGQAPTVAGIRAHIGSGSFTTITSWLREWKAQEGQQQAPEASDVPAEVTQAMQRAAELVWSAAQAEFARELAAMRKSCDALTQEANARAEAAEAEIERMESALESHEKNAEELNAHINSMDAKLQDCYRQAADSKSTQAEMRAELRAAESRCKEQAELLKRLVPEKKPRPVKSKAPITTAKE